jgi:hypothetical protein
LRGLSSSAVRKLSKVGRRLVDRAGDLGEDIGELGTYAQKVVDGAGTGHVKPPDPPQVVGTHTRADSSPPVVSGTAPPGVEASSIATAALALGTLAAGAGEAARRLKRGLHTPEQVPEEPPK